MYNKSQKKIDTFNCLTSVGGKLRFTEWKSMSQDKFIL